jgi:hypothetical protein
MSLVKKLKYYDKEVLKELNSFVNKFDHKITSLGGVKCDIDIIHRQSEKKGFTVTLQEENKDYLVISVWFAHISITDSHKLDIAKKYYIQVSKKEKKAQVITYEDQNNKDDYSSIPDDYSDYRLYEELNLLFINSLDVYLDKSENFKSLDVQTSNSKATNNKKTNIF